MRLFLKTINERVWSSVTDGYTILVMVAEGVSTSKAVVSWTKYEFDKAVWNNKALNALYNGVPHDEFTWISVCDIAKEVWDLLYVAH